MRSIASFSQMPLLEHKENKLLNTWLCCFLDPVHFYKTRSHYFQSLAQLQSSLAISRKPQSSPQAEQQQHLPSSRVFSTGHDPGPSESGALKKQSRCIPGQAGCRHVTG
ncbi:uncharacterized protein LOC117973108 [Acipenser ruthenus]|uniref:uncharacterized protein LOC117973108 n=1 Tax=Acipenser ruthenus TaxID=7906 RepID=UPI0027410ACF|nr:uncharacterized protein LOC117973108 [Acipenser ruthenus]